MSGSKRHLSFQSLTPDTPDPSPSSEGYDRIVNLLGSADPHAPQRVAAIIPAHNVGRDIAPTIRACRAIPGVDLLIVVDDGSDDNTGSYARAAGAVVVRHSVERGRASAIETGVKVAAMRDHADWPPRLLLILSADLGESAVEASALVEAVMTGEADLACAVPASTEQHSGRSHARNMARARIRRSTGWEPTCPLSLVRCATREAIQASMPFMKGYGLEIAMTIDVLVAGLSVVEIPCHFEHSGADKSLGELKPSLRFADAALASARLTVRRVRLPGAHRLRQTIPQGIGIPFPRPARDRTAEEAQAQA